MSQSARESLQHVLIEANYLLALRAGLDQTAFCADETLKRAVSRSIEIIGEAVKQVPESIRAKYPQVEWRAMAGMRDRLIHGYFSVDYDIVWDVVTNHISPLHAAVEAILATELPNQ
jgi:uncharacterized protein with HEPN domain